MSQNILAMLDMSETEVLKRLNETTSALERFEANIELENISLMRSFHFQEVQI